MIAIHRHQTLHLLNHHRYYLALGASIIFFTLSQYLIRHFMVNFDEYDHIAAGYLISQGRSLYAQIFSHHFPLPYYWTQLFTPLWTQPFRGITVFRLSFTLFTLLAIAPVAILSRSPKTIYSFSIWLIVVGLIASLFHGNSLLSDTFTAILLGSITWLSLPTILGWESTGFSRILCLTLLVVLSLWNQILILPLVLIPFIIGSRQYWKYVIGIYLLGLGLPLLYFFFNHQLSDFYQQVIWFNYQIYPQYYFDLINHGTTNQVLILLSNHSQWLINWSTTMNQLQAVIFIGFLGFNFLLIKQRNWRALIVIALLYASAHTREIKIFPGSLFNAGIYPHILITLIGWPILLFQLKSHRWMAMLGIVLTSILGILLIKPIYLQSYQPGYNYHVFWSVRQDIGQQIQQVTSPNDPILIYPHDVDLYYFAQRQPIDKFLYWFPWINDVTWYRQERIDALQQTPPAVIFLGNPAFKDDATYYRDLFPQLLDQYQPIYESQYGTLYQYQP